MYGRTPRMRISRSTAVAERVPRAVAQQQRSSVEHWGSQIESMASKGAGPRAIFDALRLGDATFDGSYDANKRFWRRLQRDKGPSASDVAIPVVSKPGEVARVDFFFVGKVFDPSAGKARKCWAFVMLLSHSRHISVDLVFDQRAETWQRLHAKAFAFFGAVPAVIVPDNLKAAVIRAAFGSDSVPGCIWRPVSKGQRRKRCRFHHHSPHPFGVRRRRYHQGRPHRSPRR